MTTPYVKPEPGAGRWDYLDHPVEQLRYAVMASIIRSHAGQGRVVELGSGRSRLLDWLSADQVTGYEGVDTDAGMLAGLQHDRIAIGRRQEPVETYVPSPGPIAALVASETLYYVESPATHLLRIWRVAGTVEVALVSTVLPQPGKPNWQRSYDRVRQALAETGWPVLDTYRLERVTDGLAWEIVGLLPGPA